MLQAPPEGQAEPAAGHQHPAASRSAPSQPSQIPLKLVAASKRGVGERQGEHVTDPEVALWRSAPWRS